MESAIRLKNNPFVLAKVKLTIFYSIIITSAIIFYLVLLNKEFSRETVSISKEISIVSRRERFIQRATRLSSITLFSIQPEDIFMFIITIGVSYVLADFALKPIRKIMDSQRNFLADASHELRTPLSIVKMDMEIFLQETMHGFLNKRHLLEERRQSIQSNLEELDRMHQMLDNLLILSREDTYPETILYKKYNLSALLSQVIIRLRESAKRKNIPLSLNVSQEIFLNGDSIRMEQAILNIVKNAIKYSHKGGTVVLNASRNGNHVEITVRDNGIGIADEDLPHVFKRFFRAKNMSTKTEGMGLGLTIAKIIIEKQNGSIQIQSRFKKGTTVIISLPYGKRVSSTALG